MDYHGLAALVLAAGLAVGFIVGISAPAIWGMPIGEPGGQALTAIGGAMVGAIAGFIAGKASS